MIYLLEDDDSIRELVVYTLNGSGYKAEGYATPVRFWAAVDAKTPRLVLLDVMLPGEDGLSVLKKLRARPETAKVPVMILTARTSEYDRVVGLDTGADDYMPKPFGMMELLARVRALLRRTEPEKSVKPDYEINGLYVSPERHVVRAGEKDVVLTYKEFELLCSLLRNRGIVMTREKLLDTVWGYSYGGESRTVDVHVRTLRQKLGKYGDMIETVRGVGYKIG